jgi:hypothetical protein
MRSITAILFCIAASLIALAQSRPVQPLPQIPKTFDDRELATLEVPLAVKSASPKQLPSEEYYSLTVAPVYKAYPVYHPSQEPVGYIDGLKQQEPQVVFDAAELQSAEEWIRAGELVFDKPTFFTPINAEPDKEAVRNPRWYEKTGTPVLRDGTLPFFKYVIREKGKIEIGSFSCGSCHTRVMPDGGVLKGAQGNFPFDRAVAWSTRGLVDIPNGPDRLTLARMGERILYEAPWVQSGNDQQVGQLSLEAIASLHEAIPAGVMARHGTSPLFPAKVPDLIGIQERRYLDATGLVRHRGIGDLMRYAALNQGADFSARYGSFTPTDLLGAFLPPNVQPSRYSDEELYALALYIYSLQPPKNPNPFDATAVRGQKIFEREGCSGCHTPPLYTNNKLTLAAGFTPSPEDLERLDALPISVGTDPSLALKTRRGTGYYKVPSLKGVWYRGPFEHNGSVATLEDWFDPKRLRDDYIPTGFKGYGVKTRAVKGHEFGLKLSAEEKKALIAFLKSL